MDFTLLRMGPDNHTVSCKVVEVTIRGLLVNCTFEPP